MEKEKGSTWFNRSGSSYIRNMKTLKHMKLSMTPNQVKAPPQIDSFTPLNFHNRRSSKYSSDSKLSKNQYLVCNSDRAFSRGTSASSSKRIDLTDFNNVNGSDEKKPFPFAAQLDGLKYETHNYTPANEGNQRRFNITKTTFYKRITNSSKEPQEAATDKNSAENSVSNYYKMTKSMKSNTFGKNTSKIMILNFERHKNSKLMESITKKLKNPRFKLAKKQSVPTTNLVAVDVDGENAHPLTLQSDFIKGSLTSRSKHQPKYSQPEPSEVLFQHSKQANIFNKQSIEMKRIGLHLQDSYAKQPGISATSSSVCSVNRNWQQQLVREKLVKCKPVKVLECPLSKASSCLQTHRISSSRNAEPLHEGALDGWNEHEMSRKHKLEEENDDFNEYVQNSFPSLLDKPQAH